MIPDGWINDRQAKFIFNDILIQINKDGLLGGCYTHWIVYLSCWSLSI